MRDGALKACCNVTRRMNGRKSDHLLIMLFDLPSSGEQPDLRLPLQFMSRLLFSQAAASEADRRGPEKVAGAYHVGSTGKQRECQS